MRLYKGDLEPPLQATLTHNGLPVNLSTATSVTVIGTRNGVQVFSRTTAGATDGALTMPWQAGDTDTRGRIFIKVDVIWPGNRPQTFEADDVVDVE